jgi:hypothetical protein
MSDFTPNPPGTVSKVPWKSKWQMEFPDASLPPAPPPHDPELDARLLDLAVELDAAVAMEPENSRTADGAPIHPTYSPEHRRPFVAADTGTQHN